MATGTIKQMMNDSGVGCCKMPDGTMICYGMHIADEVAAGASADVTIPFGQTFTSLEYGITLTAITSVPKQRYIGVMGRRSNGIEARITNDYTAAWTPSIFFIVVGRWR